MNTSLYWPLRYNWMNWFVGICRALHVVYILLNDYQNLFSFISLCLRVGNHIAGSEYCDHTGVMLDHPAHHSGLRTRAQLQKLWVYGREYDGEWRDTILCGDYYFLLLFVVFVGGCFSFKMSVELFDIGQSYKQHTVCVSWLDGMICFSGFVRQYILKPLI